MDGAIGLMSGTFSALLLHRPAFERWLKRVSGAIFGGLAIRMLSDNS